MSCYESAISQEVISGEAGGLVGLRLGSDLQSFERAAWIKHVLREPDAPDFDGYLAERLHEDA
ncbi:MAG: hypothetical protein DME63_04540 [Verrucomicrobia bacterium]|nr:MAG: hypothetical protein DME63_04540 [Verrucomicrobiota bacterium]